jgi:alpha-glucosidase
LRSRARLGAALALVLAACGAEITPPLERGRLRVDEGATRTPRAALGPFRIELAAEPGQLTVRHVSAPAKVLWQSRAGEAFLAAARDLGTVREARGMFRIEPQLVEVCTGQTVRAAGPEAGRFALAGVLDCPGATVPWSLTFEAANAGQLRFVARVAGERMNRVFLAYASDAAERFFGFGEQFTYFDLKGRLVPIVVSEQGIGRGAQPLTFAANLTADGAGGDWWTSYAPVPHYLTSRARSLFLENDEVSIFDLRAPDRVTVQVAASQMAGRILAGADPLALISEYTSYAGRMRPLPDWVISGAIVGMQGGTAAVEQRLALLEGRGAPIAAFWLQDWVGQRRTSFGQQLWWSWSVDPQRYPDWNGLVQRLAAKGIRVMTYVNPFLADVAERGPAYRNYFAEADRQGFLVRKRDGSPYLIQNTSFAAGLIDLSNRDARAWTRDLIRRELIGSGAHGWMADFGEGLPFDAVLSDGSSAATYHNRYPEEWQRINREAIAGLPNEAELVFFSRSAYTRSPGLTTLMWLGDQLVGWDDRDGIKTAVTGLLSSGVSGFAFNHSDLGGYTTISHPLRDYHRSKELQLRWTELAAFNLVYRLHEGNRPDANWQFHSDAETTDAFVRFAKVHRCWLPYRKALVAESAATGWPVHRHPVLHWPGDETLYTLSHQEFLLGDQILVAPVLDAGAVAVDLYLPAADWTDLWSGEEVRAGWQRRFPAPIGKPPVFYRTGSASGEAFRGCLAEQGLL